MSNPLSLVYDGLWDLVIRHPDYDTLFSPRNLIRFDGATDRDPLKTTVQDADLPELMLVPTDADINIENTSNTSKLVQRYTWVVSTGDLRITDRLLPVEWFLFEAMHNWSRVLTLLKWPLVTGQAFVKRVDIINVSEGMSDPELNRGIRGWSAIWGIDVEMYFTQSDIRPDLESESSS